MKELSKLSKQALLEIIQEQRDLIDNKFGLFFDRTKNIEETEIKLANNMPLLKIDYKKSINNVENRERENILIKGDNLEVLSSLNLINTGSGLVDIIYIDPPYNTGNNDFTYNDKIVDSEDGFRHSKWLNFINKRLKLSRQLMKDSGIIFISIDDNEQAHLKLLCDSIFGERNFIQMFLWNKNSGGSSLSKFTRSDYEYILCYAKNISRIKHPFMGKLSEGMGDSSLINKPNKYKELIFPPKTINFTSRSNGLIQNQKFDDLEIHNDILIENSFNTNEVRISAKWKWSQDKLNNELENGTKIISKSDLIRLRYIKDNKGAVIKPTMSIQPKDGVGFTVSGSSELKAIFDKDVFSFPKPVSLIKYLIKMYSYQDKNEVILDFFAGSGTTGQAVLELNDEDDGKRTFILVTNNENDIMDNVCYPRIKTLLTGVKPNNLLFGKKYSENVIYYDSQLVTLSKSSDQNNYNVMNEIEGLICIQENTFKLLAQKEYYSAFINPTTEKLIVIYKDFINEDKIKHVTEYISTIKFKELKVFIFSTDQYSDIHIQSIFKKGKVYNLPSKLLEKYEQLLEEL